MIEAPATIQVFVEGCPKAQPRPRAFARKMGNTAIARVYDPGTAESWKSAIAQAIKPFLPSEPICGAVKLSIAFFFARPKAHYRTGKRASELRPDAPGKHLGKPDLDNCIKAVKDALSTLRVWRDDCAVCEYGTMRKAYANRPGAQIVIEEIQ